MAVEDSVAADQLRAFIERIEQPAARVDYVVDTIEPSRGLTANRMHRAFNLAAIVLGVDYEVAKLCLRRAWLGRTVDARALVGRLTPHAVGFVYRATSQAYPGWVKIGFSSDPKKRAVALGRRYGAPVQMQSVVAGTMLQEMAEHSRLSASRMTGEWFREAA